MKTQCNIQMMQTCTLEMCIILLTNVILVKLIKKESITFMKYNNIEQISNLKKMKDYRGHIDNKVKQSYENAQTLQL